MKRRVHQSHRPALSLAVTLMLLLFAAASAVAGDYPALQGVKGLDSVFDVTIGSPRKAIVTFQAIRGVYLDESVRALANPPSTVIVFLGPGVKLVSSDHSDYGKADEQAFGKLIQMIRQFKKDGVRMEVCMHAVKALGIDPATLMPEVHPVGNGFISVLGYQAQGYSMVKVP